jgi:hypothetical protein
LRACKTAAAALFVTTTVLSAPVAAQNKPVLRGRVLAGGQPVPNQPVALHRVTNEGQGFTLDTTTTDLAGRFELQMDTLGLPGVLFAAARYQGELYIGQTFRSVPTSEYQLMVGPDATPIDLNTPPPADNAPVGPDNLRAGLAVIVVGVVLLSLVFGFALRHRVPPERRLLLEIAELDNRNVAAPMATYEEQRAELVRRLRESA